MYALILTIHLVACVCLIVAVLLQAGKGADIGAVFGGAGSQALFGSAGPVDFIKKATLVMVVVFMLTSFTLAFFAIHRPTRSVMSDRPVAGKTMPAVPGKAKGPAIPVAPGAPAKNMPAAPIIPVQPTQPAVPGK
ncbi:MAG TPA: preprotein translocase subunit SecG [Desulfomonilia bacterium]|nr:preprotein translocase subunit SecG [Desulfomonilia bacterium]